MASPKTKFLGSYLGSFVVFFYAKIYSFVTDEAVIEKLHIAASVSFEIASTLILAAVCLALSICNSLMKLTGMTSKKVKVKAN